MHCLRRIEILQYFCCMKLLTLAVLFLFSSLHSHAQFVEAPKREYRAVWLTTIKGLDWPQEEFKGNDTAQRAALCTILDSLKAININTILLQTRIRGDVIYPSEIEPFSPVFTGKHGVGPSYDPLAFAIDECHKRGMQLHTWLVTIPLGDATYVKAHGKASLPSRRGGTAAARRANITHIMRTLYHKVKSLKPWVCVSAATLGKYDDTSRYSSYGWNAYHTVHQEAQEWMRMGIVDAIFPMLYYAGNHFYPFVCDWGEHAYGRHVVAGLGTYQLHPEEKNWELEEIVRQLHVVRIHPTVAGTAQFRSQFVTDNTKGVYELLRSFHPYPALVPPMPWLNATRPTMPQGLEVTTRKHTLTLTWQPQEGVTYNIYSSNSYPVDTTDPSNLRCTYYRDTTYTIAMPSLVHPHHYAVTAIDRYGNESEAIQWESKITQVEPKQYNTTR